MTTRVVPSWSPVRTSTGSRSPPPWASPPWVSSVVKPSVIAAVSVPSRVPASVVEPSVAEGSADALASANADVDAEAVAGAEAASVVELVVLALPHEASARPTAVRPARAVARRARCEVRVVRAVMVFLRHGACEAGGPGRVGFRAAQACQPLVTAIPYPVPGASTVHRHRMETEVSSPRDLACDPRHMPGLDSPWGRGPAGSLAG